MFVVSYSMTKLIVLDSQGQKLKKKKRHINYEVHYGVLFSDVGDDNDF